MPSEAAACQHQLNLSGGEDDAGFKSATHSAARATKS